MPRMGKTGLFGNPRAMDFAAGADGGDLRGASKIDASHFERIKVSCYI